MLLHCMHMVINSTQALQWQANNLVYENKSEDKTINLCLMYMYNYVLFLKILIFFPKYKPSHAPLIFA